MNQITKIVANKKISIIFMMFVFFLLSNVAAFGQATDENNAANLNSEITINTTETSVAKQENISSASNMNLVLWFMGSKQDPNVKISKEGINTKKQFMTSGMAPNRLLIKAFLKKAVNFESSMS